MSTDAKEKVITDRMDSLKEIGVPHLELITQFATANIIWDAAIRYERERIIAGIPGVIAKAFNKALSGKE